MKKLKILFAIVLMLSGTLFAQTTVTTKSVTVTTKDSTQKTMPVTIGGQFIGNFNFYEVTVRMNKIDSIFTTIKLPAPCDTTKPPTTTVDTIWRGLYVSGLSTLVGNKALEDAFMFDCNRFKINHVSFYGVDGPDATKLDAFLQRIKRDTKVTELVATGGAGSTFKLKRSQWNAAHPNARFNGWNLEFEPWNATDVTTAWNSNKAYLADMTSAAPAAGVTYIYDYYGWWTKEPMLSETPNVLANSVTAYLIHDYTAAPSWLYLRTRCNQLEATGVKKTLYVIFSAEPDFMQTWLKTHTLDEAYGIIYAGFKAMGYKNIKLGGYIVFTLDFLRVAQPTPATATKVAMPSSMMMARPSGRIEDLKPMFSAKDFKNVTADSHLKMAAQQDSLNLIAPTDTLGE